jgi:putative serine protease PepD
VDPRGYECGEMNGLVRTAAVVCALAAPILLSACGGSATKTVTVTGDSTAAPGAATGGLQQSFISVIDKVSPEVVQISNPHGLGSGIVFDKAGDIVTNAHVVAGGGPLRVTDSHGRSYSAKLVGAFPEDDLAVVRANAASLPPATFAAGGSLHVGDIVLALGNPLGLRSSVTNGIISALGRTVGEPNQVVLPDVIQTSAPINPGNSGGALVNLRGQVVGIPTLAATDPQLGGGAAPGIGFAIPSTIVKDIAGQIVKHGHVVNSHRAYLGVKLAGGLNGGAIVVAVQRGGPAAKAGIIPGDAITALAGKPIAGPDQVVLALAKRKPGQTIKIVLRKADGSRKTVSAKLGEYPAGP